MAYLDLRLLVLELRLNWQPGGYLFLLLHACWRTYLWRGQREWFVWRRLIVSCTSANNILDVLDVACKSLHMWRNCLFDTCWVHLELVELPCRRRVRPFGLLLVVHQALSQKLSVGVVHCILVVGVRVKSLILLLEIFEVLSLTFCWQEFLMNHLECVWNSIILSFESSEWSQNWVVNAFDENHFFKRIVVLTGFILLVPAIDSIFGY